VNEILAHAHNKPLTSRASGGSLQVGPYSMLLQFGTDELH
jgi:hypothetical protein